MLYSQFSPDQYIDADSLNAAMAATSGSLGIAMAATLYPGLIGADSGSFTVSGLTVNSALPAPFGVLFGAGVLSQAHGTVDGADTTSYATSFSGLVPAGSGSVTAYLLASYQRIQQNPYPVVGPPPGHPDFNPNFLPFTAYASLVDSLSLAASSGAPDNATTFELCRFTLTSGLAVLPAPTTSFQVRFAGLRNVQSITGTVSGSTLTVAGKIYNLPVAEVYLLPPLITVNDTTRVIMASGPGLTSVISASGDFIYGCQPTPAFPAGGLFLLQGQACEIAAVNGVWQVLSGSPWISMYRQLATSNLNFYVSPTGSDTINTGLTPGSPFQTVKKAYNYLLQNWDLGGQYTATLNLAAGTYGQETLAGMPVGQALLSQVVLNGAGAATTTIGGASGGLSLTNGALLTIQNVGLAATGSGASLGSALTIDGYSTGFVTAAKFLTSSYCHVLTIGNGTFIAGVYDIAGDAPVHLSLNNGTGSFGQNPRGSALNLVGLRNFSGAFVSVLTGSVLSSLATFTGSGATGQRYYVDVSSTIVTWGAGANYFPGSIAGSAPTSYNYQ